MVEWSISEGWRVFRARPIAMMALSAAALVPTVLGLWPVGVYLVYVAAWVAQGWMGATPPDALPQGSTGFLVLALVMGPIALASFLAIVLAWSAQAARALDLRRRATQEPPVAARRSILGGGLAVACGIAVSIALLAPFSGLVARPFAWYLFGTSAREPRPSDWFVASGSLGVVLLKSLASSALTVLAAFAVWLAVASIGVGVMLWPLVVLDRGAGLVGAPRRSWALTRGHRLELLSLLVALVALNIAGAIGLGVGLVVTTAVSTCALVAFYDRLARSDGPAGPEGAIDGESLVDAGAGRWSALAVGAWLYGLLAMPTVLVALVTGVRPLLDVLKTKWVPYGSAAYVGLLAGAVVAATLVYLGAALVMRERPGVRIVGRGWGRFEWLALPLFVALAAIAVPFFGVALPQAGIGFLRMGVAQEMARTMVSDLPTNWDSRPGSGPTFEGIASAMDFAPLHDGTGIHATYGITDSGGRGYSFMLGRYPTPLVASGVMEALEAYTQPSPVDPDGAPRPVAGLGDEALSARPGGWDPLVELYVRAGDVVLAGEARPEQEEGLRDVLAKQLDRLDAACERVAWLYDRLPKSTAVDPRPPASSSPYPGPGTPPVR